MPFFFATGHGSPGMGGEFVGSTIAKKPFRQAVLAAAIQDSLAQAA